MLHYLRNPYKKDSRMPDTTMKGRSCFFAAVVAAIVCMALPSFAADRTISSNYTLTADETVDGILTVESGVTVDLDGHNLTVQGLAGKASRLSLPRQKGRRQ